MEEKQIENINRRTVGFKRKCSLRNILEGDVINVFFEWRKELVIKIEESTIQTLLRNNQSDNILLITRELGKYFYEDSSRFYVRECSQEDKDYKKYESMLREKGL